MFDSAEKANKFERIVGIAVATEINGLVINVKDDNGFITYNSNVEIVQNMNKETPIPIKDIDNMLKILNEYDIYTIGRIVAFKDKNFAVKEIRNIPFSLNPAGHGLIQTVGIFHG